MHAYFFSLSVILGTEVANYPTPTIENLISAIANEENQ